MPTGNLKVYGYRPPGGNQMNTTHLASQVLTLWNLLKKYDLDPDDVFRKAQLDPSLMY